MHATCAPRSPPNALAPPGPHLFPHRMPASRLGRARRRSISRSASTRPRSQTWKTCSLCAPRVPCPYGLDSGPPRARHLRRRHPMPSASRAAPLPASHARLSTRQRVHKFNQPLSFDTSKVTTMSNMFAVRSARALAPCMPLAPVLSRHPVHMPLAPPPPNAPTPPGPYRFPHHMPAFRIGSPRRCSTKRSASTRPRS